jgi:hypothetical protein
MVKHTLTLLFILDLIVIIAFFSDANSLISSQVAFLGSAIITTASFSAYKKVVSKRLEEFENEKITQDKDLVDKLTDTHDLYEEETKTQETEKSKEEDKLSFKDLKKTAGASFALKRILAYIIFIVAIIKIVNHGLFEPIPFFIGLSIVPVVALYTAWKMKNETNQLNI